jgi:phage recombination protein Bet
VTDTRLARQPNGAVRPFGSLPPAQTGLTADRALELAGVDATELALLASTTFKEARSLEELVTLIATTRRRGLDALLKQVYYERFGGASSEPSLHVAIDGLREIAAATGRYAGRSEPRFNGVWDMPLEDKGATKPVPEKCSMTVYAIVQTRICAFEGVAWMEESYPGTSGRGRMWRQRPRGMLAIAAERQALRSAFPSETGGLADHDDDEDARELPPSPSPPRRTVAENAALYDRIMGEPDEVTPQPEPETDIAERSPRKPRERIRAELIDAYAARLEVAFQAGLIPEDDIDQWTLSEDATREQIIDQGLKVVRLLDTLTGAPAE